MISQCWLKIVHWREIGQRERNIVGRVFFFFEEFVL